MLPLIILISLLVVPVLIIMLFRSNAAIVFLALCAGIVLQQFMGANATLVLQAAVPHSSIIYQKILTLTLLLLPALVAIVRLRKKVTGLRLVLNILPALLTAAVMAIVIVPVLSDITRQNVMHTRLWSILDGANDLLVGGGVLLSMLLLKPKAHKEKDGKHGKH